jgi:hypothetical protein
MGYAIRNSVKEKFVLPISVLLQESLVVGGVMFRFLHSLEIVGNVVNSSSGEGGVIIFSLV